MHKRIEITMIERERITRIYGQMFCPKCQKREARPLRRFFAAGMAFLKARFFNPFKSQIDQEN